EGVPEDNTEAVKWFRKAADQGHARAQNKLGMMYAHGKGVSEDDTEAVKWYRRAAGQGDAAAQYRLDHHRPVRLSANQPALHDRQELAR
ncbi:MAG: tetratricopeptide repeat protein, partial [Myxococcota bacterium]